VYLKDREIYMLYNSVLYIHQNVHTREAETKVKKEAPNYGQRSEDK
jgi:hypothetical protein